MVRSSLYVFHTTGLKMTLRSQHGAEIKDITSTICVEGNLFLLLASQFYSALYIQPLFIYDVMSAL
jgi:hypothetical protein